MCVYAFGLSFHQQQQQELQKISSNGSGLDGAFIWLGFECVCTGYQLFINFQTSRTRRPFKVWDSSRATRKALVVASLEELIVRGREKLGIGVHETVRVVLETDGTQVDDSEYFRSLPVRNEWKILILKFTITDNTVFLLLRISDRWCPAALSSIPRIVCEAISSLELQDEVPSWKIMESRGEQGSSVITIVLTWNQRPVYAPCPPCGSPHPPARSGGHPPDLQTTHRHDSFARRISPCSLSPQSTNVAMGHHSPVFLPPQSFGGVRGGVYGPPGGEARSGIRTMITKDGKYESVINDYGSKPPTITVINSEPPYDSVPRISTRSSVLPPPLPPHGQHFASSSSHPHSYQYTQRGLPRQGSSSLESGSGGVTAPVHVHTVECSQRGHVPQHPPHGQGGRGSPPEPSYCDFHCCALHEEGRKIQTVDGLPPVVAEHTCRTPKVKAKAKPKSQQSTSQGKRETEVHKAVATSPIQDTSLDGSGRGGAASSKSLHVRFMGVGDDKNGRFLAAAGGKNIVPSSLLSVPLSVSTLGGSMIPSDDVEGTTTSSESETENNHSVLEEEKVTTQKFLLLIDQLSLDQKRHLSIKDIGVILERLSSKIVDVERLDRETEAEDCYNWTIKATIKGEFLRELGVIYNGNFYAISEHPNYPDAPGGSTQQLATISASSTSGGGGGGSGDPSRRVIDDDCEDMRL
ncbi:Cell death activator CIDE-A [Folsomia candida]|uniref:Cell death activator CIDE-A n=1 Tax=Folsomia candida TaxID=158441 RepID=A0A226EI45_FOLCA|nr:Cell death activator CIDE-A [Folsomia candida]